MLRAAPDLSVDVASLVLVSSVQFAGCALATLSGGFFCDRFGKKIGLQAACALMALGGGLSALAGNLSTLCLAAALLGMGGGVLESMASALLADLFPIRRKQILALSQVAYCAGAAAGPAAMAWLLPSGGSWRIAFLAEAILALALLVLFCVTRTPAQPRSDASSRDELHPAWLRGAFLLPAVTMFFYVLSETGVIVYANIYLQQQRMAPERWGMYGLSLVWLSMLAGRLLCAALPERLPTEALVAGFCIAGAMSLGAQYLVRDWRMSCVLLATTGFFFSGIWPLIVAITSARHPLHTGSAVGVTVAAGALGAAAAPPLISALLRASMAELVLPLLAVPLLIGAAIVPIAAGQSATSKPNAGGER